MHPALKRSGRCCSILAEMGATPDPYESVVASLIAEARKLTQHGSTNEAHMATERSKPTTIDEYISAFSPEVRAILQQVRHVVRRAAPDAQEAISYGIPAFKLNGVLVYFAAFKKHIGFFPPVEGDARLQKAASPYAGEKGNLRFPLDRPIPFDLIERITKLRVEQNTAKAASKAKKERA